MVAQGILKRQFNRMGLEIFKTRTLPFGLYEFRDALRSVEGFNPRIIFDVGANIGQTSVGLRSVFKDSEVYAFEPVGSTYEELVRNVSGLNVKTFNLGLGSERKRDKIYLQPYSALNSLKESLNQPDSGGEYEEVEVTTIDAFCSEHDIDEISVLKIDTEGYGLQVLEGARDVLGRGAVESVFIEVGFSEADKRHDYFWEVSEVLHSYSFDLLGFYDQWIENARLEYCNAFFTLNK